MSVVTKQAPKGKATKKANKLTKADKERRAKQPAKMNKRAASDLAAVQAFDKDNTNAYKRLQMTAKVKRVDSMGLNKALKDFLKAAKETMTAKELKCLTFANVKAAIEVSPKYKDLQLFTEGQMTLICNKVLKGHNQHIARAAKVERQNKAQAKK